MARDWQPGVYPKPPKAGPFWVKFKVWERRDLVDQWGRAKGFRTRAEARAYGDQKKDEWRKKEAGLWNEKLAQAQRPVQPFIDAFEQHVLLGMRKRNRRRPSGHVSSIRQILRDAAKGMNAKTLGDLSSERATNWLTSLRDSKRPATLRAYRGMLVRFGLWLEDADTVAKSPFRGLTVAPVDYREHRQSHDTETVVAIAWAAVQRVRQFSHGKTQAMALPKARHRALTYLMTFLTTMRGTALANCAWSWFDETAGCLTIPAEWVKRPGSPRAQQIPLHEELAKLLREVRRERGVQRGSPVQDDELVVGKINSKGFAVLPDSLPTSIRSDAKMLDILSPDADGRVLDVTALRTSCATELRRMGVPRSVISEIMHTARPTVADRHYIHTDDVIIRELRGFMNRIPFKSDQVRGLLFDIQADVQAPAAPRKAPGTVAASGHQTTSVDNRGIGDVS